MKKAAWRPAGIYQYGEPGVLGLLRGLKAVGAKTPALRSSSLYRPIVSKRFGNGKSFRRFQSP